MHLLLTVLLLLSQQAVFSHAASHLGSAPASQDQQLPHSKVCDQCVQGAQLGTALLDTSQAASWIGSPAAHFAPAPVSVHLPRPLRPFYSRAPPVSL
jgi:hypothetical protein